ncbi:MAG: hypothetical protein JSV42_11510 [Chloroflexota bacterium]|nr:MAG: hypothetical protein JSV42_11510 [Chloroflexota bacterium]
MRFRLRNTKDPSLTLGLTSSSWFGILTLAEEFGWNPMGAVPLGNQEETMILAGLGSPQFRDSAGEYGSDEGSFVLLEDALNLADALERAVLNYEPQYIPSLQYYTMFGDYNGSSGLKPGLGAIQGVIEICYLGMFKIENF